MWFKLILKFVGDENDLHRVYVMVDFGGFFEYFAMKIIGFRGF